jgi:hypothetical protein
MIQYKILTNEPSRPSPKGLYFSDSVFSSHQLCTDSPNGYLGGKKIPEDKKFGVKFEERKIEN